MVVHCTEGNMEEEEEEKKNMYSISDQNNMEFMNNIGAYRQTANEKWRHVWRREVGNLERKKNQRDTKEEQVSANVICLVLSDFGWFSNKR